MNNDNRRNVYVYDEKQGVVKHAYKNFEETRVGGDADVADAAEGANGNAHGAEQEKQDGGQDLTFLLWNCDGLRNKTREVCSLLCKYDIITLVETWCSENDKPLSIAEDTGYSCEVLLS